MEVWSTGATLYNDTQMFLSENPTPDEERRTQLILPRNRPCGSAI